MWLDPTDATPQLQTLQAALQEAFPKCSELSTISDSFKPHLSVGQVSIPLSHLSCLLFGFGHSGSCHDVVV